jgi:peptide/nickel transport system permease protein
VKSGTGRAVLLGPPSLMDKSTSTRERSGRRGLTRFGAQAVAREGVAGSSPDASRTARSARGAVSARSRIRRGAPLGIASGLVLSLVVLCALIPELIAPYPPTDMQIDAVLTPPSAAYWFGTDQFGRDVLSLVIFGARQSLLVGVSAVLVGSGIGVSIGLLAGYFGGWLDMLLMRLIDIWMAVPNILLAIALSTALGPSLSTTILAVSVASIPRYARVLRGRALAIRSQGFVLAARASGASHWAILRGHIFPHCLAPALVLATLGVGGAILMAAGLSFLGLGVNDDRPDWGYLLTQGRGYVSVAWWAVTYPGLALTALVVSVNLLGDALRRRLDPHGALASRRGV